MMFWSPSQLGLTPLKHAAKLNPDTLSESTALNFRFDYIDIGSVTYGKGITEKQPMLFSDAPSRARKPVKENDLIVSSVRTYLRAIARIGVEDDGNIVSTGFAVCRPRLGTVPDFLYYAVHSQPFIEQIVALSSGMSYPAINPSTLGRIKLPLPPPEEQAAIANFLDRETTRIDGLIEKKARFIELLKEKRTSLIHQTVTKGLDVAVPMTASRIQWIGDIPSTWKLVRIGILFTERKQKVSDKDYRPLSVTKTGIHPQLETVAKTDDGDNRKLVRAGDFVINSRSDRKSSSGVSRLDGSVSLINIVLEPKNITPEFCNYILKSHAFVEDYYRMGHGIVADLWTTPYDKMRTIILPLPSIKDQYAIAAFLDRETTRIDAIVAKTQRSIELLKEKRTALITAAVTGSINVDCGRFVKTQTVEAKPKIGARPNIV